jgi:hypothetical protein
MIMPSHLISTCGKDLCRSCAEPVRQADTGRWYITMGHSGFNLPANNRNGYASKARAVAAHKRCCPVTSVKHAFFGK